MATLCVIFKARFDLHQVFSFGEFFSSFLRPFEDLGRVMTYICCRTYINMQIREPFTAPVM